MQNVKPHYMAYVIMTEKGFYNGSNFYIAWIYEGWYVAVSCTALLFRASDLLQKLWETSLPAGAGVRRVMQGQAPIVLCQEPEPWPDNTDQNETLEDSTHRSQVSVRWMGHGSFIIWFYHY